MNDHVELQVTERSLRDLREGVRFPKVVSEVWGPLLRVFRDRALLTSYQSPASRGLSLWEWDLKDPSSTTRKWKVRAPKGRLILDYLPSPDFKRAVWTMGRPGPTQLSGWSPYRSISLWSSGLHGEGMREIGEVPFPAKGVDGQTDHYQRFGELQWNPDFKRISFVYYRRLYVIRAGA